MRQFIFYLVFIAWSFSAAAQEEGTVFFKGDVDEAAALARKQDKKLFLDFYTSWCGPCKKMLKEVFPLPEVGEFFNRHFISVKVNAEMGKGRELATKYKVTGFPTYIYLDPVDMKLLHRSSCNKKAGMLVRDAKGALDPRLSSVYLDSIYQSGHYDVDDLVNYIYYRKSSGQYDMSEEFGKLLAMDADKFAPKVWNLFRDCIDGMQAYKLPYVSFVSGHYAEFVELFGREEVDAKLEKITCRAPEEFLAGMCDFRGKDFNIKLSRLHSLFRGRKDGEAWGYAMRLIGDTTLDVDRLIEQLGIYTPHYTDYRDKALTFDELVLKVRCCRYVAYNWKKKDSADADYHYAVALEYLLRRSLEEGKSVPKEFFNTFKTGKERYDIRSRR